MKTIVAKIAFLFLVRSEIFHEDLWHRFFKGHENQYSVYIHSKNKLNSKFFKKYEIPIKVKTNWENTMNAQIMLLKFALKDLKNMKFIFISESTIPLQNFDYVYKSLFSHPHSQFNFFPNPNLDRNFPPISKDKIFKNSQWVVLNRKHAEQMVADSIFLPLIASKPYDNEHYPSTFLLNKGLSHEILKNDVTLVIWKGTAAHPHIFTNINSDPFAKPLFDAINKKQFLFARKFAKNFEKNVLNQFLSY